MTDLCIIYSFSRAEVEACDFSRFLASFGRDALPCGPELARLQNAFIFTVDDYESTPAELYTIPEVRAFYAAFHRAWPYWFYFCNLDDDTLKIMTLSCLQNVSNGHRTGQTRITAALSPIELAQFISADADPMSEIWTRAQLEAGELVARLHAVFAYFGIDLPR